jgi:transglutaminase-like putative cysteine protease
VSTLALAGPYPVFPDDAPPWLRRAAGVATPQLEPKVRAVVLLDESEVLVGEDGKISTTRRRAVRVLTGDGRHEAAGRVIYLTGAGRVKDVRGFLVWPNGDVQKLGKERVLDVALAPQDVYNEVRARVIVASDEASPGVVFGFESALEDTSVFSQFEWPFQDDLPVMASAFSLTLPAGWGATGVVYNHAPQEPAVAGRTTRWELRDLPPIESEPARPALTSIVPWLAVSLVPPAGAPPRFGRSFKDWPDVALWLSQLADPQAAVTPEVESRARELTRDAATDYERIRAIGRHAQGVKYVSIQTGLGRGGGYRPHAAAEVLSKNYGDCKDKANLMRALLKAAGIESYPVAVFSGDRERVREDWPSPQQFNHAIIAVRLEDEIDAAAVATLPLLGRVLFFDPTDEYTPVGLLPQEEEGSLGLLVSADKGTLVSLPRSDPEANRVERRIDVTLAENGSLSGRIEDLAVGHAAASYRREHEEGAAGEYRREMEAWVSKSGPGASVSRLDVSEADGGARRVALEFTTPIFAKSMGGGLLVLKPRLLPERNRLKLYEKSRKYPVVLRSEAFEERLRMKLPEGFELEEMPPPSQGRAAYGSHSWSCEVTGGYLSCVCKVTVSAAVIPVEQYKDVRKFFAWVNSAGDAPVVLAKKAGGPPRPLP